MALEKSHKRFSSKSPFSDNELKFLQKQQEMKLSKMLGRTIVMECCLSTNNDHTEGKPLTFSGRMSE